MLKQVHFNKVSRLCDILLVLSSFYLAYGIRFDLVYLNPRKLPTEYQIFLLTNFIAWIYFTNRFRLYASKRMISLARELLDVGTSVTLSMTLAAIPSFFIRDKPLSRIFLLVLWQAQIASLVVLRIGVRESLKYFRRRGYDSRSILIIGRNERADKLVRMIHESPELGLRILGFIDSTDGKHDPTSLDGYMSLGSLDDLEKVLRRQVVDEVFVSLPIKSFYSEIQEILSICENVGVECKMPADLFSLELSRMHVSFYEDIPLIDFYTSPKMCWQLILKRLIDISIAAVSLVLFVPLFGLAAVLIKATSKGPVFFKQKRVGYNGRTFTCFKFRTMVYNAESLKKELIILNEMSGPVFKIRKDPRLTKIGRVLRQSSFDELPQLINVLKGDMSLVGPRPPIPEEVREYQLSDRRRLSMRPGITCLWQVNGRSNTSFDRWMELDKQYIDQWCLWLDVKILAKTIPAVLRGSGAA